MFASTIKSVAERIVPSPIMHRLRAKRAIQRGDNPELALLKNFNHGGIFIDIGANIGDYSRVASLIFREVIAFEPIPQLAYKLRRELPKNVKVIRTALSDKPGGATLYIPDNTTGLASLDATANGGKSMEQITVAVRTLDSYEFAKIDCIKIDVEGLEESVLRGAVETIRKHKPTLIVEIEDRHHPGKTRQVFELLLDLGYEAFYLQDDRLVPVWLVNPNKSIRGKYVNNFVFIPV